MDEENGSYAATVPRMRIGVACELCRVRKVKCNGQQPCPNCWQHGISCVYRAGPPRASRRRKPVTSSHDLRLRTKFPIESTESATPHRSGYYPARIKRQMDLRAGIGVSNSRTGSFQFYGEFKGSAFSFSLVLKISTSLSCRAIVPFQFHSACLPENLSDNTHNTQ